MGKCYRCGQEGHFARECNAPHKAKACYRCGQQGHFARECTASDRHRKSKKEKSAITTGAPFTRRGHRDRKSFADTTDGYFLIDVSGSMSGARLEAAKDATREIVSSMDEADRMAIVTFDTNAYFKLKPRPVGQIRRQNELPGTLDRIYAQGLTALWDAIYLSVSQIRDKSKRTVVVALTDGQDNSSTHTYEECRKLIAKYPALSLSIVHIGDSVIDLYKAIAEMTAGDYVLIREAVEIKVTVTEIFRKHYVRQE